MSHMSPCWSCGAIDSDCTDDCACAKCVDPDDYYRWRRDNPRSYALWMARNVEDVDEADRWYERALDLEDYE